MYINAMRISQITALWEEQFCMDKLEQIFLNEGCCWEKKIMPLSYHEVIHYIT